MFEIREEGKRMTSRVRVPGNFHPLGVHWEPAEGQPPEPPPRNSHMWTPTPTLGLGSPTSGHHPFSVLLVTWKRTPFCFPVDPSTFELYKYVLNPQIKAICQPSIAVPSYSARSGTDLLRPLFLTLCVRVSLSGFPWPRQFLDICTFSLTHDYEFFMSVLGGGEGRRRRICQNKF